MLQTVLEFVTPWQVLVIPVTVMIISQFTKLLLESRKHGFDWSHMNSYGGMPSSHTAMTVSLMMMVGLEHGFTSPLFAVAFVFGIMVIRDAVGIRWQLGFHGAVINDLIDTLSPEVQKKLPDNLEERLGHTYKEMVAGAILGTTLTLFFFFLLVGV